MSDFVILNGIVWWRPRLEQIAGLVRGSAEAHPLKRYSGLFFARAQLRGCPAALLPLERKGIQVSYAGADLRNVDFSEEEASLRFVNFSDAKLDGAIFGRHQAPVDLAGASLRGADLRGCNPATGPHRATQVEWLHNFNLKFYNLGHRLGCIRSDLWSEQHVKSAAMNRRNRIVL